MPPRIDLGSPLARCRECGYAVSPYSDEFKERWVWREDPRDKAHGGHFVCWGCLSPEDRDKFGRIARRSLAAERKLP